MLSVTIIFTFLIIIIIITEPAQQHIKHTNAIPPANLYYLYEMLHLEMSKIAKFCTLVGLTCMAAITFY